MSEDYIKDRVNSNYRRYSNSNPNSNPNGNYNSNQNNYANNRSYDRPNNRPHNRSYTSTQGDSQPNWLHSKFANTLKVINKIMPSDFKPKQAFILGSGLGNFVDTVYVVEKISFKKLPGFFSGRVPGQAKDLIFGYLGDKPVVILSGRVHLYEGATPKDIAYPVRFLKLLGCETLVLSNAAGSLNSKFQPGDVALIEDHINLQWVNPLIGENLDSFGPRFVPMENAYDFMLRQSIQQCAQSLNIDLKSGIYGGVLGPMYETPAEIRAMRTLGADLVGMSTVGEVIAARHCGMKVLAMSAITNMGAGLTELPVNHDSVLDYAEKASDKLFQLMAMAMDLES